MSDDRNSSTMTSSRTTGPEFSVKEAEEILRKCAQLRASIDRFCLRAEDALKVNRLRVVDDSYLRDN